MTPQTDTARSMDDIAEAVAKSALSTFEQLMREHGTVAPPMVHVLVEELPNIYAGFAATRQFYRGEDAATAIAGLGSFPASMVADRVLVCWENSDLNTALKGPGNYQTAVMILEVDMGGTQSLRWHPFSCQRGPDSELGIPTVLPQWSRPHRTGGKALPGPVRALLRTWQAETLECEFAATIDRLEREGYRISLAA